MWIKVLILHFMGKRKNCNSVSLRKSTALMKAQCFSGEIKFSAKIIKAISKRGNNNDYRTFKISVVENLKESRTIVLKRT